MSDKISFVPDTVRESVENSADATKREFKKGFKEVISQIFGVRSNESKKQEDQSKKIAEKAEKSGKTIEEQAKIEALRRQLHAQVTAPRPQPSESQKSEQEDNVGTNETIQPLGNSSNQNDSTLPPLAQPSLRHGERLKIRE